MERGTGITTRQIADSPADAVYICVNSDHTRYCKSIASKAGRNDIRFVTPGSWQNSVRGTRRTVVIDHAAHIDSNNLREILISNQLTRLYRDSTA